ncbi:MAG: dienelactone hydrolase family protein [Gemmatimonadetes bacterium]|nr:dienelactone hydrolase family protein [Gemmatimonadota bacterium]
MTSNPLTVPTTRHDIHALLRIPAGAEWLYVFAHGAGAGMRHAFMEAAADALSDRGIATLRYEYPYMSAGSRRPDRAPVLEAVTRDVVTFAAESYPELRIAAGGKSMGGRMTSRAQSEAPLPQVEALIFFGFPLHPPKVPSTGRADHLARVEVPLLFLQGTRDTLADLEMMKGVTAELGDRATLHVLDGADHGFAVLKRSGRTDGEVLSEMADTVAAFLSDR